MTTVTETPTFHSQYGEDKLLWQMFRGRAHGFFIDIGAYDGVTFSNTCLFERMGWQGIIIEPHRSLFEQAAGTRPRSLAVRAACSSPADRGMMTFTEVEGCPLLSFLHEDEHHLERCRREGRTFTESQVRVQTMDEILDEARHHAWDMPAPWSAEQGWSIDLVSLDVEGGEMRVLEGFDLARHRPKVLVIECDRPSAAAVHPYMAARGYVKVHRQCINDFYVRKDCLTLEPLGPERARVHLKL
jgi:hypothetical protein